MATITPSAKFMVRLVPAIVMEAIVLAGAVLLYVYTGQLAWIFVAAAAGVVFAIWVLVLILRHRTEWRWYDGTPGAKS